MWDFGGCIIITDRYLPFTQQLRSVIRQHLRPIEKISLLDCNPPIWCFHHCIWKVLDSWLPLVLNYKKKKTAWNCVQDGTVVTRSVFPGHGPSYLAPENFLLPGQRELRPWNPERMKGEKPKRERGVERKRGRERNGAGVLLSKRQIPPRITVTGRRLLVEEAPCLEAGLGNCPKVEKKLSAWTALEDSDPAAKEGAGRNICHWNFSCFLNFEPHGNVTNSNIKIYMIL